MLAYQYSIEMKYWFRFFGPSLVLCSFYEACSVFSFFKKRKFDTKACLCTPAIKKTRERVKKSATLLWFPGFSSSEHMRLREGYPARTALLPAALQAIPPPLELNSTGREYQIFQHAPKTRGWPDLVSYGRAQAYRHKVSSVSQFILSVRRPLRRKKSPGKHVKYAAFRGRLIRNLTLWKIQYQKQVDGLKSQLLCTFILYNVCVRWLRCF